ncbi:MAG: RIP metalloprotease RseP [Verrucomicrobiae bacterium]|nr:RIP metalloprotease RseP [Verrucomicrobiae bacterium]
MSFELIVSVVRDWVYPVLLVVFFFGLTIFAHELGHFLVARRRGMKVERFSIGFGPPIWKWTRNGVEYRVSWIPCGGYVMLPQMAPMEVLEGKSESKPEELPPASPADKILVSLAGPVLNVALAFVLACALWWLGTPANPSVVGWVEEGSPEELCGIRPGDRIVQVNDQRVKTWGELMEAVAFSRQSTVQLHVERGGEKLTFAVEARLNEKFKIKTLNLYPRVRPFAQKVLAGSPAERAGIRPGDRFVSVDGVALYSREQMISLISQRADQPVEIKVLRNGRLLGLTAVPQLDPNDKVARIGVRLGEDLEILRPGAPPLEQFREVLGSMARLAKAIFHYKETGVGLDSFSGPVGISVHWWYAIVSGGILWGLKIAVILNINLAILNLLPLPVLDGGHIIFSAVEAAIRRPLPARLVQVTQTAFAALLIGFMLYITVFSDLRRFLPDRPRAAESQPAPSPP